MFASLKSKIKEETGSDLGKLTSSWRAGSFLGRISQREESNTTTSTSSGGVGDSTSESITPQLEAYLSERTGGSVDQISLQEHYTSQLEAKLVERDAYWERKIEELLASQTSVQGEEAAAAQAVARTAQAEAARATAERDAANKQLNELKERLAAAERAQERLDTLNEELEESRRQWARDRAGLAAALGAAEARAGELGGELALLRAAAPPGHPAHRMLEDDKRSVEPTSCEQCGALSRERAVLRRQLQEAKLALADVKTSWSGQIASLETQVARLSRQAGEEGAERRRVEAEKRELQDRLDHLTRDFEKTKQQLANSEAKVTRLSGEVHSLALETKSLRGAAEHAAEKTMEAESRLRAALEENEELRTSLENERTLVKILQEKVEKANRMYDEKGAEVERLAAAVADMRQECCDMQRRLDKERREKDEALLRNAHVSQRLELVQCDARFLRAEADAARAALADHTENQAECMLIKEADEARRLEIEQLNKRIESFGESEAALRERVREMEADVCDKNKKIKTLDNRIADMKKTLQRELQNSSKSDLTSAEEQDISRRYLKHVVLRFLTARSREARQLTRALAVLLRLSAHEEALLRAALPPPPRAGLAAWLPSLPSLPSLSNT